MQTYLFYDIETTGLNKAFDQVLQFAAIRTDLNLNELERYELKVKLNPDVIPSPKALITHHIGLKESQSGISEIEAIKQIHNWLNHPGTISLGYNTLGFDDEFLRFSFYKNLLSPYTHQYANQCSRMDIYPMAMMYFLYKNHVIQWPKKEDKISLKLEELNQANQFVKGAAHNAIVDVEATLALAKRFYAERDMWDYLISYFNKNKDQERSDATEALMVYGKFGSAQHFLCPVLFIGNHSQYKNQLWLRLDSDNLSATTPETIKETTWAVRKKLGEPGFILPYKERFLKKADSTTLAKAEVNKKWLQDNPDMLNQIVQYHINELYPYYPETDVEARLYLNGFWTHEENTFCRRFHAASPKDKALMTESLTHSSLKILATRLLGRHYTEYLTPTQADHFNRYMQQVNPQDEAQTIIDFKGNKRLTPKVAYEDILELKKQGGLSTIQEQLLVELENDLKQKFNRALA